ncbi:MAG: hypothetical protein QXL57_07530 [Candidatus Bathyarchaeia archaeon]
MKKKSKAENNNLPFIMGITDKNTVKLDFDKTKFRTVKYWAMRTMRWFKLKGFIILKSSKNSYHVVFDKKVSWEKNVKIMAWVSLLSQNKNLQKWFTMQAIKEGSTLRVSAKKDKPEPRIVFRYGSQENQIAEFLAYRKIVKGIIRRLEQKPKLKTEPILKCSEL